MTTFRSYGAVGNRRQGKIIRGLGQAAPAAQGIDDEALLAAFQRLASSGRLGVSS